MTDAKFTYVLIPANDDDPLEELSATAIVCGDTLKESLRKAFGGGELTNFGELEAQYGALASQNRAGFERAARQGSVEVLPILRQSATTMPPNTATFLYYDEMGALKQRPDNRRAQALALQCGLALEHPLPGDVYVGRVCCDPGPVSVSIRKDELGSGAPWLQRAAAENKQWEGALADFHGAARANAPGAKTEEQEEAEEARRGWRWAQTCEEVEVTVDVPEGTGKADVSVDIGGASLRVALRREPGDALVDLRLYAGVLPEDCTWTLLSDRHGRHVQVTLAKKEETEWPLLEPRNRPPGGAGGMRRGP